MCSRPCALPFSTRRCDRARDEAAGFAPAGGAQGLGAGEPLLWRAKAEEWQWRAGCVVRFGLAQPPVFRSFLR
jgi:hypothetical protein